MVKQVKFVIDPYVIDILMRDLVGHDRAPSAFLVYLWLASKTLLRKRGVAASLQMMADATGLSKSSVSNALAHLRRRRLIETQRNSVTAIPSHKVLTPWRR